VCNALWKNRSLVKLREHRRNGKRLPVTIEASPCAGQAAGSRWSGALSGAKAHHAW
jgi:hypothetical protein